MGSIVGQIAFGSAQVDSDRVRAALAQDPSRVPPAVIYEAPSACLAAGGVGVGRAGPIAVALDGALHARADLAAALRADGDGADPVLIAAAWGRWGAECPPHLLGDYAFALQDTEAGRALLVRDHIGTRPLHWHWDGRRLSLATFLPALLALLPEAPGADEEAVAAFLRWPTALDDRTFFAGIRAVEPGCAVALDAEGPRVVRWWRPEEAPAVRYRDRRDYAAAFRELTERAVRDRLPEGAPDAPSVGAHLSGGIDSTLVALAAEAALAEGGRGLTGAYSWSPPVSETDPEMEHDERARIAEICTGAGLEPRFTIKTGADFRAALARPFEWEGLADVSDEFPVLDLAERDGVQLLLSGWGGDEAVSAHAHGVPAALLRRGRPRAALGLIRKVNQGFRPLSRSGRLLWRNTLLPLLPDPLYARFPYYENHYGAGCHISPRLAAFPLDARAFRRYRITGEPAADMAIHLRLGHIGDRMATWAAWAAPQGIEYRYPLTDRRLLEFVLGVPPDILWGDGRPRYLARAALSGRTTGRVGKSDPANERQRWRARRECWRLLATEAADGAFDGTCDWLDMDSLRRDIARGPSDDDDADIRTVIRMMPAVRVWHMAERFGAVSRPKPRVKAS